jgi:hypothetical protein
VHKGRRWWLNIKVKERPIAKGSSDCKFYKPSKLWYLLALRSHCHNHKHLEWLKLMQERLRSICLTNHKLKTSCPVKYEYPNLMLLDLGSQASSCHCKYMRIIENRQRDTSMPNDMEQAHIKMIGQTDNEHLGISFIYHWYIFFILRCVIECPLWACCKFPPWIMHGLD